MTLETSPGDVGGRLQEARQLAKLSLRQVSDSTKIPVDILQAIERNDVSRVPGGLYVRGYVRSFATVVGLDPESTVAAFVAQFPNDSVTFGYPAAQRVDVPAVGLPVVPDIPSRAARPGRFTLLRFAAVSALSAVLGVYMGMGTGQGREAAVPTASVAPVPAAPAVAALHEPYLTRDAQRVLPERLEPAAAVSPSTAATEESPVPAPGPRPAFAGPLAVVVAAKSPSWVILTVDGRKAVNRLLQVGERETIEARSDLVVTAGDAGAIVMTLNGRLARSIGRPGETVTARVSRANFRDYLHR
jgi:hypothetical protein